MGVEAGIVDLHHPGVLLQQLSQALRRLALLADTDAERAQPPQGVVSIVGRGDGAMDGVVVPDPVDDVALAGDYPEGGVVVPGQALGRRVDHQVAAVLERPLDQRSGKGGIDHPQWAGHGAERIQVDELQHRVGRGLHEHQHRTPGDDGGGDGAGVGTVDEGDVDPEARAHTLEEQGAGGVELALGHHVVALGAQRQHH